VWYSGLLTVKTILENTQAYERTYIAIFGFVDKIFIKSVQYFSENIWQHYAEIDRKYLLCNVMVQLGQWTKCTWTFHGQLEKATLYTAVIDENTKLYLAENISQGCELEWSG
jgi:hypothetical protein